MRTIRQSLFSLAGVFALAATAGIAQAATYYVTPGGSDSNPGTQIYPFHTIQHAITAAPTGSTINVAAGTYAGSITWAKDLVLVAAGAGKTIINGSINIDRCMTTQNLTAAS